MINAPPITDGAFLILPDAHNSCAFVPFPSTPLRDKNNSLLTMQNRHKNALPQLTAGRILSGSLLGTRVYLRQNSGTKRMNTV